MSHANYVYDTWKNDQSSVSRMMEYACYVDSLIDAPAKWTKNAAARTPAGEKVAGDHSDAVCWCLVGGAVKGMTQLARSRQEFIELLELMRAQTDKVLIQYYNDAPATTFLHIKRVMADVRRAIRSEVRLSPDELAALATLQGRT